MYIHWVSRSVELNLTSIQAVELEKIFGAVRTMHNMVMTSLQNISRDSIIKKLMGNDTRDTFATLNKNVAMVRFAEVFIHNSNVDDGVAEIMAMASKGILLSHVSLISQSWVEYLSGERQRPEYRDNRNTQCFWLSDVSSIIINDHSLTIPSPSGELYFEYNPQNTYGVYDPVCYRLSKHDGRYFLGILYEKEIDRPFQSISGIHYPPILDSRGGTLTSLKYEIKQGTKTISEEQLEGMKDFVLQIRRFALNRLTKRKESTLFYP